MDFGQYPLHIFASLVVVLGAACVALICDFLKRNNEYLRELTIELKVRREEQQRGSRLLTARALAATAQAAERDRSEKRIPMPAVTEPDSAPRDAEGIPEISPDALTVIELATSPSREPTAPSLDFERASVDENVPAAPAASDHPRTRAETSEIPANVDASAESTAEPAQEPRIELAQASQMEPGCHTEPAGHLDPAQARHTEPTRYTDPTQGARRVEPAPPTSLTGSMASKDQITLAPSANSSNHEWDCKADDSPARFMGQGPAKPVVEICEDLLEAVVAATASDRARSASGAFPAGFHDGFVLSRLVQNRHPVSGLVVSIGVNTPPNAGGSLPGAVRQLVESLIGPEDFACQSSREEFLLIFPHERGASAQRRLSGIAQRLWDFQLRSLGTFSILFTWGGVEVRSESIDEAIASATERMQDTRRGRKLLTMEPRTEAALRKAV